MQTLYLPLPTDAQKGKQKEIEREREKEREREERWRFALYSAVHIQNKHEEMDEEVSTSRDGACDLYVDRPH